MKSYLYKIGILAYGSLIDDPGIELMPLIIDRINCDTPFNVEFARVSKSRDYAPTLIPVLEGGSPIRAQVLVLKETVSLEDASSMLWRRERHIVDTSQSYSRPQNPNSNTVLVEEIIEFCGIERVIYTSLRNNIEDEVTPELLANFALESISKDAGAKHKDGVRYLFNAKKNNIVTPLSEDYEREILKITNTTSLEEAIQFLDKKRENANTANI